MNIKDKIKSFTWERWLDRAFSTFVTSLFTDGITKKHFKEIGMSGVEAEAMLVQKGIWYSSEEFFDKFCKLLKIWLKTHSVFDVSKSLENFEEKSKEKIKNLIKQKGDLKKQLKELYEILTTVTTFIWVTHGLEVIYKKRLHKIVPKYVKKNVDKFIGDASFPKKKNAHVLMEEDMRNGVDPKKIVKKFGWLKARETFSKQFSVEDIKKQIRELEPVKPHPKVKIPKKLKPLFEEVQELVFLRTARTDVFYELLFLSRPFLRKIGRMYKIPFSKLQYYTIQSLINGNPMKYSKDHTYACYKGKDFFSEGLLIKEKELKKEDYVKGMIAYKGKVKGVVKIVRLISDLGKVRKGDILVTQMTFPSFISAMNRAKAFVTDEGGITCHASIIAREMRKPCVIGTKTATKMFKDGDLVEVDANKGIVRKIK